MAEPFARPAIELPTPLVGGLEVAARPSGGQGLALGDTGIIDERLVRPRDLQQDSATDGQALVWDSTNSRWQPETVSGGATVATTVAGLGSATDGKIGHLRVGATPFEFVTLIYDSTYGKWVSQSFDVGSMIVTSFTSTSAAYAATSDSQFERGFIQNAKALYDAGLRLQVFIRAGLQNSGANDSFVRCALYEVADDDTGLTEVATGGELSNNGTTFRYQITAGWQALTFGALTDAHWQLVPQVKVSAGTGTFTSFGFLFRWVSA